MKQSKHFGHQSKRRIGGAGIGLLVVLIAVVIGMWLMFGKTGPGGSSYMGNINETREDSKDLAITMQARQIAILVAQQETTTGNYPESMQDIEDFDPQTFVDEWGEPFGMKLIREGRRATGIELRSAGRDGLFDTEDDVVHIEKLPY